MPKDKIKDVKICFIMNVPVMAVNFKFSLFENNFLVPFLKYSKSKDRFIKEIFFENIGLTISKLLNDKNSDELQ